MADAVNVSRLLSLMLLLPIAPSTGATFTSPTVTTIVSKSFKIGSLSAVARTVMLYVPVP